MQLSMYQSQDGNFEIQNEFKKLANQASINHKVWRKNINGSIMNRNRMTTLYYSVQKKFESKHNFHGFNIVIYPEIAPFYIAFNNPALFNNLPFDFQMANNKMRNFQEKAEISTTKKLINIPPKITLPKQEYKYPIKQRFSNGYIMFTKKLGAGSFGQVYEGIKAQTLLPVAIKIIDQKFQNQVNNMKQISSKFIIKMYDSWRQNRKLFMALELCQGTLEQKLRTSSSLDQKLLYCKDILHGVAYLGRHGIIHRDLKLQNILVKQGQIKIADLGFAKQLSGQLGVMSIRCGTPSTMAPEIYFQPDGTKLLYDKKCDVWSLGVIIHEIVYRKHPFDCNIQKFRNGVRTKIQRPINKIEYILKRTLKYRPQNRISLDELINLWQKLKINEDPYGEIQNQKKYNQQKMHININLENRERNYNRQPLGNNNTNKKGKQVGYKLINLQKPQKNNNGYLKKEIKQNISSNQIHNNQIYNFKQIYIPQKQILQIPSEKKSFPTKFNQDIFILILTISAFLLLIFGRFL